MSPVRVLGSSSAGNATVVRHENTVLLIDCGFPPQYIERHLAATGLHLTDISAVLLIHVHGDHVNQFLREESANAEMHDIRSEMKSPLA